MLFPLQAIAFVHFTVKRLFHRAVFRGLNKQSNETRGGCDVCTGGASCEERGTREVFSNWYPTAFIIQKYHLYFMFMCTCTLIPLYHV